MGNSGAAEAEAGTIGNAYLAKVLQGAKREVDSHVEIQCNSTREMYEEWKSNAQVYRERLLHALPNDAESVSASLLFPSSTRYEDNRSICGDKQGKVVLEYSSGFLSLQQSKSLHIQENMPYTSSQIWNLLLSMVEYHLLIKRAGLLLQVRSQSIYTDLRTKVIRLRNPFSFFGNELKYRHEKYIDTEKLELVVRGLKVSRDIEHQNDAFNIGMILVEVMLLESCCLIYDDGLSCHKTINPTLHEMLIEKVLKLGYYPLKLRMIVAGLIQLHSRDRFTCEEVFELLKDSKQKIKNFHSFHLRKTAFLINFKHKLTALESSIAKVKQECNAELFKESLPFAISQGRPSKQIPFFSTNQHKSPIIQSPTYNMDQSLNFSITNLGHTNRQGDYESLMLSRSDNKSSILHLQEKQKSLLSAEVIKSSDKSVQSLHLTAPPLPVKTASLGKTSQTQKQQSPQEQPYIHTPPELSPIPDIDISNPFDNFQKEKEKSKSEVSQDSKLSSHSKKTPSRAQVVEQKSERRSNSLKVHEESIFQPIKELVAEEPLPVNLELIQHQKKISVEAAKENEQEDISCISHKDKDPSQNSPSRNSSVVEYVSQLYETQRVGEAEATRTDNIVETKEAAAAEPEPRQSWESESDRLFFSFEPQKLFIKKTESYEIQSNSRSSVQYPPPREVSHQGSIIDRLAPLVTSKKVLPQDTYKPDNLTDSARKRIEYWNTFSKFSPEVIAQLHLPARYPDTERLKRSMRETISYHNMAIGRTKTLFPEGRGSIEEETSKVDD